MNPENEAPTGRSRKRRNVVGSSAHRAEYVRLMENGWSSESLERYAAFRYGEDIPARTFRAYKQRAKIRQVDDPLKEITDSMVDPLTERQRLIELQKGRIAVDVRHEQNMQKLFGSTRHEIQLLSSLLSEQKTDLQDVGLMPKAGESVTVHHDGPLPDEARDGGVPSQTLADLLGADPSVEADLARVLHLKQRSGDTNGTAAG